MPFPDNLFDYVLGFGLYHNLESGLEKALNETYRVMNKGGFLVASFRADNIQTKIVDKLYLMNSVKNNSSKKLFHKLNLNKSEISSLISNSGF